MFENPLYWNELKTILKLKQYSKLHRKYIIKEQYINDTKLFKIFYRSVEDMIKIKYFKFKSIVINNKVESINTNMINKVLCENNYGYNVEKNVEHKLLWSLNDLSDENIKMFLDDKINKEYIYFRNPANLRSIPDLFHIHVFIKTPQI